MITGIFGKPRSGKTTYAARMVQKNKSKLKICNRIPILRKILKPYDIVYCTDPTIQDTIYIDYKSLGRFKPSRNSLMILEEAGIGLDNRKWKTLTEDASYLFALHGHLGCDILWSSQTVDVDKKLLSRTHKLWLCSRFFGWTILTPIKFSVDVDTETKQLVDAYTKPRRLAWLLGFIFGSVKHFWRKPWYKYFDSFNDFKQYPEKDPAAIVDNPDCVSSRNDDCVTSDKVDTHTV